MGTNEELVEGLQSFGRVYAWLKGELVDRDTEIRLALICLVAKQHLFLLGPPGTGKSYLARLIGKTLGKNSSFFELLLTRFTDPSEVFGPVSVRDLVSSDKFARRTEGYLPDSECAFLDEIWKSSSAILNSLLTIVNERVFDNGGKRQPVPLKTLFAAANELPQDESLEALYDRFLVRREVRPVKDPLQLIDRQSPGEAPSLTHLDLIQEACKRVQLPGDVKKAMKAIKDRLAAEENLQVGDRRFQLSASLVRASAVLDGGRAHAEPKDLLVLSHSWWSTPDQFMTVGRIVSEEANRIHAARKAPAEPPAQPEAQEEIQPRPGKRPPPKAPAPPQGRPTQVPPARPQPRPAAPAIPGVASANGANGANGISTNPVPAGQWTPWVQQILAMPLDQLRNNAQIQQAIHDCIMDPEARNPANKHYLDRVCKVKQDLMNRMLWVGPRW